MARRGRPRWLFSRRPRHSEEDAETLRRDFRRRYMSFKLLLSANHRALEGGKFASLGEIHNRLDLPVPDGFVERYSQKLHEDLEAIVADS